MTTPVNPGVPEHTDPPPARLPAGQHRARERGSRTAALVCFTTAAAAANAATFHLPPIPVGFGLSTTAGTLGIGLVALYMAWLRSYRSTTLVVAAIATAAIVSCLTGSPIGIAWGVAYLIAEAVGAVSWQPLVELGAHRLRAVAALALASTIDTVVFVATTQRVMPLTVSGQLLGKVGVAVVTVVLAWSVLTAWRHRHPLAPNASSDPGGKSPWLSNPLPPRHAERGRP